MSAGPTVTWSKVEGLVRSTKDKLDCREARCVLVGPMIYIFDASTDAARLSHVFTINLSTRRWDRLRLPANYPSHVAGHRTLLIGDQVLFLGSVFAESARAMNQLGLYDMVLNEYQYKTISVNRNEFELSSDLVADVWESKRSVLVNMKGSWYHREATHTYMIDIRGSTWSVKKVDASGVPPSYRYRHSSVLVDSKASSRWFIVGGSSPAMFPSVESDPMCYMYILDLDTGHKPSWSSICPQEVFGELLGCPLIFGKNWVLVFGRDSIGYLDVATETWIPNGEHGAGDVPPVSAVQNGVMFATRTGLFVIPKEEYFDGAIYRAEVW